jgi:dihydrofolate synthase/folylpolyglutamate synthase
MSDQYQAALDYLYSFVDYETMRAPHAPANYDLRRMDELLARLGNPHLVAPAVHIAGTKGKGSTAAMVASALMAAGYRTGLYTSPHLIDLRERVRVDGRLISRHDLVRLVECLQPEVEAVNARATYGRLTTFELLTVLGFLYFAEQKAEFQVVEVGLGGRLDATNVLRPEVTAITTLGLDHTEMLGNTLAQIAGDKAGIIKTGIPVVSACQEPEALAVLARFAREKNAQLVLAGRDIIVRPLKMGVDGQRLAVDGRLGGYAISLPLLGQYQQENATVAVGLLEVLAERGFLVSAESIERGLGQVRWPGRFQVIRRRPLVIADGAHNPAAAAELKKAILGYPGAAAHPRVLVVGTSADKDYTGVAALLGPLFDEVVVAKARHPRALDTGTLAAAFQPCAPGIEQAGSVPAALERAVELAGPRGFVCATGSLFLVGEALSWAHKRGY